MKAYFDKEAAGLAILVIEPESADEAAAISLWHEYNVMTQAVYAEMANSDTMASISIKPIDLLHGGIDA